MVGEVDKASRLEAVEDSAGGVEPFVWGTVEEAGEVDKLPIKVSAVPFPFRGSIHTGITRPSLLTAASDAMTEVK